MLYRGEEVHSINSGGIYSATQNYIQVHHSLGWDEYNGNFSDVITNLLRLSKGIMDATIEFQIYNEEDYSYVLVGWKVADENQKNYVEQELARREAVRVERIEQEQERERALYNELVLKYGTQPEAVNA